MLITTVEAFAAGIHPNAPDYDATMAAATERLLAIGALERDHEADHLLANVSGDTKVFSITGGGIDLLHKTGA